MVISQTARWASASELLGLVRTEPAITRRVAGDRLGLSTSTMSDLVERLQQSALLSESPAPSNGPGRPSMMLMPHKSGPLVAAVHLRSNRWTVSLSDLSMTPTIVAAGDYEPTPADSIALIGNHLAGLQQGAGDRLRAVVVAVAGVLTELTVQELAVQGWPDIALDGLLADIPAESRPHLAAANDATLAGLAESRRGSARRGRSALHILLGSGVGGALVASGRAIEGAQSSGGEFGHLPFGRRGRRCRCGATACWTTEVGGERVAELLGEQAPSDPESYLEAALDRAVHRQSTPELDSALDEISAALGAGISGLVNAFAPDVVTLGGMAPTLRQVAPHALHDAFDRGLMTVRRRNAPVLLDAHFGAEGPIVGALHLGHELSATPAALALWESQRLAG